MRGTRAIAVHRILLTALMCIVAAVFFYPVVYVLINAFKSDALITLDPMGLPRQWYPDNFIRAWQAMEFPRVFMNTFIITVVSLSGIILISALAAYKLARTDTRLSWLLYGYFVLALVIPFQIIMVPIAVLSADLHLMNIPGIIVMYWGLGCPTAIFMFHGFIKSVPRELEESAAIDGAGQWYIFFAVVFPLLKTIVATVAVIDALWLWNDFLLPLIVIKQGTIQLAQMIFNGQFLKEYGPMTASLTLSALPIVLFYLALQKYIIKGIAAGAVKG
ncbi:MAG TPA: carbohydrate ABC transporter permease [Treponemataceae bacterium]|nr:carbohydrate ABC transporter permease [Treponemataceae bacterium]